MLGSITIHHEYRLDIGRKRGRMMEDVIKVDDCVENIGGYDIQIHNAIIVPENATNGDMIKAMFPNAEIKRIVSSFDEDKLLGYKTWLGGHSQNYYLDWWNAPYSAESEG